MIRQILCGVTLLAFVNFLMGCTSVEKVPVQEAQVEGQKIDAVVLLEGDLIQFDSNGGTYRPAHPAISFSPKADITTFVSLDRFREYRISPPKSVSLDSLGTAGIREVVLRSGFVASFQDPGARYDSTVRAIKGTRTDGKRVSYNIAGVASIRTEVPEAVRTSGLNSEQTVYEALDPDNFIFTFGPKGGHLVTRPPGFYGTDGSGKLVEVSADDVLYARVTRTNAAGTILATLGVIAGAVLVLFLIALATKQSCPFIYSFNGEQYIFDAEPLGGAICPGLARTDISRLESIKAVDGEYRLLIRNEVPETQYLDRMKLLLVDHPPDVSVYPDLPGNFHAFKHVQGAISASDENGMSLMKFLRASDNVAWQTNLPSASKTPDASVRHELTVTLPKPPGARKAWLVTNIGTSSWGSNMIRKTVEYRGNTAADWLKSLTPGSPSYVEMFQFINSEEMYSLNVWVKEGESWKKEAVIQGQGPLISEERVYPVDVSNAAGDSLVLRFNPPKGFWTFDYIGVSYEDPTAMSVTRVDAHTAQDEAGTSILDSVDGIDRKCYVMAEVGDQASVTFRVPQQAGGTVRSIYLETNGYYELHLSKDLPDQLARLYFIGTHPGQIVKTAMEEFRAWQAEQQSTMSRPH